MDRAIQQTGAPDEGADRGTDDTVAIGSAALAVRVKAMGAELCGLRDRLGREYLWQAGPAWPRHAPILFPVVGRLHGDAFTVGGMHYPMGQHGFARDSRFTLQEHRSDFCRFLLTDSPESWERYPFPFRLEVAYLVRQSSVTITYTVTNPGETVMPFSIGAHPALAWPLPGSRAKHAHALEFEQEERGPFYRPTPEGLLDPTPHDLPLNGRTLGLREDLFSRGAMVLLSPVSRRLRYAAPGAAAVEMAWQGFEQLGLWMKPGADFLCLEPWAGHADIVGHEVEAWHKPGIMLLHPGESRRFLHRITIEG